MDVTLQRHCARYIYVVPDRLKDLMSDVSREVLRNQPADIYTFIADYLDALLITRENARVAAKFVQDINYCAENVVDLLIRTGMNRENANKAAEVIQTAFKNYAHKKGIMKDSEEHMLEKIISDAEIPNHQAADAAIMIQSAFRAFKERKEREKGLLSGIIDWRIAARSAIKLYRKTGVSTEEARKAANLIKAAYKGYYTRRAIETIKKKQNEPIVESIASSVSITSVESYLQSLVEKKERKSKTVRIDVDLQDVDFEEPVLIAPTDEVVVIEEVATTEEVVATEEVVVTEEEVDETFLKELLLESLDHEIEISVIPLDDEEYGDAIANVEAWIDEAPAASEGVNKSKTLDLDEIFDVTSEDLPDH